MAVPQLIGITLVSFMVIHLAPGSVSEAVYGLNPQVSSQAREKLDKLYGLDRPVLEQYKDWALRLVRLDFGESFVDGRRVSEKVGEAIPVTLCIGLLSLMIALGFGISLGVWSAEHRGTKTEKILSALLLALYAMPGFWLALLAMSFFGVSLDWFPVSGLNSIFYEDWSIGQKILDTAWHLVLPVIISSVSGVAAMTAFIKSGVLEVLGKNYIRTARAKGLSEKDVHAKHALANALLPVITIVGLSIPGLLGGSVVLESLFSIPGMGRLFFSSVFSRDYPVIMAILVIGASLTLLGNILADFAYKIADPRTRKGGA